MAQPSASRDSVIQDAVNALRASKKDCYEQALVTSYIVSALKECGASKIELLDDVVRQPHLVHLRTQIAAVLAGGSVMRNVDQLLRVLNPTPAVCGLPTADARTRLADLEQADRYVHACLRIVWRPRNSKSWV